MNKYTTTNELALPIQKGRYYGIMVDLPLTWQGYTFAAYLRVGSVFTPMDMVQVDSVLGFMRYKIQMKSNETKVLKGSGKCEIQISIVDTFGDVYDVLVLDTFLESNVPNIIAGGGSNG